jgi:putative hydrolase of the HAD superfamily
VPGRFDAVTFDAGNTLLRCHPPPRVLYAEALSRYGPAVTPEEVAPAFADAWVEMQGRTPEGRDRYSAYPGGERAWWGAFLREVLARLAHPAPWEPLLDDLYAAFARPDVWQAFPEVIPTLERLGAAGLKLAVISNWDRRLPEILSGLRLDGYFSEVVVSAREGVEKPASAIFKRALERLDLPPRRALHVGDSPIEDYQGAQRAGLDAALVDRHRLFVGGALRRLDSLEGVLDLL